jgi:hypothetical protein
MQSLNSTQPRFSATTRRLPAFGRASGGPGAGVRAFKWVSANRTREMLVEDLVGFGFLRTGLDLMRNMFYGTGGLNFLAAGERLIREAASIFTDNILSGLAAAGLGKFFDRKGITYSNGWTDFPTMELFRSVVKGENNTPISAQSFQKTLIEKIAAAEPDENIRKALSQKLPELLDDIWKNAGLLKDEQLRERVSVLARETGLRSLNVHLNDQRFELSELLDDVRLFSRQMAKRQGALPGKVWSELAKETLEKTLQVKRFKLLCLGLGMAATLGVPFLTAWNTRKQFGVNYYPGDIGLKGQFNQAPVKQAPVSALATNSRVYNGFLKARAQNTEKTNPNFVKDSWKKGNKWPLIGALIPLIPAFGFFNTVERKFMNPLSPKNRQVLKKLYDFSKAKPFTTQQQMASAFALLIFSRLICSRSDNEYRERIVDSGMGWAAWILATPFIKQVVAKLWDSKRKSSLFNQAENRLWTLQEIKSTLANSLKAQGLDEAAVRKVVETTERRATRLGIGSTLATMFLLGVVEPVVGILWSKHNSARKEAALQAAQSAPAGFANWKNQNLPSPTPVYQA